MYYLFLLILSIVLSGCASIGRVETATNPPNETESIFVLGVSPPVARVSLSPGIIEAGKFDQDDWGMAVFMGLPENGYIIGKGAAGTSLAIMHVRMLSDTGAFFGSDFKPCGNSTKTLVFNVPDGKVIYLGNLAFTEVGRKLAVTYSNDFQSAKQYVDTQYPGLKDRLEPYYYLLLSTASCY